MKKKLLLHAELSKVIASMGHRDQLVIGDAGLPVPKGVPCIDLALSQGIPGFLDTLRVVLDELEVELGTIDAELAEVSPDMAEAFAALWPEQVKLERIPHSSFMERMQGAKAVVRTGEYTPYSNIILQAGVVF